MARPTAELERKIRDALNGLPLTTRGLWHEMRELIEQYQDMEGGRLGYLQRDAKPLRDDEIAIKAGSSSLKVSRHLQRLESAELIQRVGEAWHSPLIERIAVVRINGAARKAKSIAKSTKKEQMVLRNTQQGVTFAQGNTETAPNPSPPASSPSHTLPLTPPTSSPDSYESAAAQPPPPKPSRKSTPQAELWAFYREAWEARYGKPYPNAMASLNFVKSTELLKAAGGSMDDAKAIIRRYLAENADFYQGHPIAVLTAASQLPRFVIEKGQSNGHRKPTAADRGEYDTDVKVAVRKLPSQQRGEK